MISNVKGEVSKNYRQEEVQYRLKEIFLLDLFRNLTKEAQDEIIQNIKRMLDDGRIGCCNAPNGSQ